MGRKNTQKKKQVRQGAYERYLTGTLDITRSGMGFVVIGDANSDVMVKPADFGTAMHGDTVKVKIKPGFSKKLHGEIVSVLERKRTEFVGTVEMNKDFAFFIADSEKLMPDFYIPLKGLNGAKDNDRVIVQLVKWEGGGKKPVGEVMSILEPGNVNDTAMKELLLEGSFPLSFSDEALEIAARLPEIISADEIEKRRDFRNILTFTIDPVDAKDFDDAISVKTIKKGVYEIGVHIADVSHYVTPGNVLDDEAYTRATSVYLPDRVNPMLPEEISNVLCSLRPNEDKLCFSAVFTINTKAVVTDYWLGRTVIHSDRRFTYEEVQEIIEAGEGELQDEILLLHQLAQKFRKARFDNGAINFSSQEVRFQLDDEGNPTGIVVKESKESHQLIEEMMLLANRYVASHVAAVKLKDKPLPFPYRIHDTPDEEKLLPFMVFAKKFGYKFDVSSPESVAKSFNMMLHNVEGKPEQHVLEQLGIRTMAKARYTTQNIGHYGLGFENYCHFTSPIRRYPDVLVHRILQEVLNNTPHADKKLEEKCTHCSERERVAMDVERKANKFKQVQYMRNFIGEDFEGVVSGVASFGFWVETVAHKCEGLVGLNSLLEYDEFRLVEEEYCLVGRRSGKKFRIGDKVTIKVAGASLEKRQLDYVWVAVADADDITSEQTTKVKKGKRKL